MCHTQKKPLKLLYYYFAIHNESEYYDWRNNQHISCIFDIFDNVLELVF